VTESKLQKRIKDLVLVIRALAGLSANAPTPE
jgi:hypothetical protein